MIRILFYLLLASCAGAQEQQFAKLGDFSLQSGEVIRDCRIGYRTFGKLNASRSNAILFPTWFSGKSADLAQFFGPSEMVDTGRFFGIAVDAIGDGVSSSPSNSAAQPRLRFPKFSIADMVRAEHQLVTRTLGISKLHAVMGISMGGMQTFAWVALYPEMMNKAIPIVGSPRLTATDMLLWQAEMRIIEENSEWKQGEYTRNPPLRALSDMHQFALTTPSYRATQTSRADAPRFLADTEKPLSFDANDWYRQLQAMMTQDIGEGKPLEEVAQRRHPLMLIVVAVQDHMVNPLPAMRYAELSKARVFPLAGECGHLAPGCEKEKLVPAVRQFLAE